MRMQIEVFQGDVTFTVFGELHEANDFELEDVFHAGESLLDFLLPATVKKLEEVACEKATQEAAEARADQQEDRRDHEREAA